VVNADPLVRGRLRVVFLPDFKRHQRQGVYPAADLSSRSRPRQGGLGHRQHEVRDERRADDRHARRRANVEIRDAVGADNFFLFGLTVDQVGALRAAGYHRARCSAATPSCTRRSPRFAAGAFSRGDSGLFRPLVDNLLEHDPFLVLADYRAYVDAQDEAARTYLDSDRWSGCRS